jgi:nucleoside-diphosphate-sugar epimerase
MNKNLFLFGGGGYIGTEIVKHFEKKRINIFSIDNYIYNHEHSKKPFLKSTNLTFLENNLINLNHYISGNNVNYAVILLGLVGDPITKKYPKTSKQINLIYIKKLLNFLKKKNFSKIIFISTCSNYGAIPNNVSANEDYKLRPRSLYAKQKVEIEDFLFKYNKLVDSEITILRFATAFGISERMRFDLTINEFTREAFVKKKIIVYDPDTWRPYCHVKDFARIVDKVIHNIKKRKKIEVFNCGSNRNNFTKRQIVKLLKKFIPNLTVTYLADGVDKRNYKIDFTKVKKYLNFTPLYSVKRGIFEILSHLKNKKYLNLKKFKDRMGNYKITNNKIFFKL